MSTPLIKNTLYLTIASTAQKVIAFTYFAYLSSFFGAGETGAYFVALGIITTLAVFEDLGLTSVLIREVAKKDFKPDHWLQRVMGVKLITIPIVVVLAIFGFDAIAQVMKWLGSTAEVDTAVKTYVQIGAAIMVADTLSLSFFGVLRGLKDLRHESLGIFIGQMLTAGLGMFFMLTGMATMPLILLALMVGSIWNLCYSFVILVKRLGLPAFKPSFVGMPAIIKMAGAFFIGAVFVKLMSYFDSFLLITLDGKEAVGNYAVAYKFTYAFQFLPLVFVAALYPEMSSKESTGERLKKITLDAFWYMMLIGSPIIFGLWAIAPSLIDTLYDLSEYGSSIIILQTLVFVLFFIFLDFPLGSLLNAKDRQLTKTIITGVSMGVNIIANILLVPTFGGVGAAIAALCTFGVMLILDWWFARDLMQIGLLELGKQIGPLVFAGFVMGVVVVVLREYLPLPALLLVGAVVYPLVAWLLGGIDKRHLDVLKRLVYVKKKSV